MEILFQTCLDPKYQTDQTQLDSLVQMKPRSRTLSKIVIKPVLMSSRGYRTSEMPCSVPGFQVFQPGSLVHIYQEQELAVSQD